MALRFHPSSPPNSIVSAIVSRRKIAYFRDVCAVSQLLVVTISRFAAVYDYAKKKQGYSIVSN